MKKKKLITLCIAAVAVIFGYGGMKAYKNVGNNNLMLANVEDRKSTRLNSSHL